jgi:tetratricopeptide (TPR) repeat protein
MTMFKRSIEPEIQSPQQSFLLGERSLRAYFAGGNVRFLQDAETNFGALRPGDKAFDNARFYLGVTKTQLRKTEESIKIFENLRESADRKFKGQISLQLAYAHIKNYTAEDYKAAEQELNQALGFALDSKDTELELQTKAIQVFLYSVLAGRPKDGDKEVKRQYASKAVDLGEYILKKAAENSESVQALRFEALNALGITWMRIGEYDWDGYDRTTSWSRAQRFYDQALLVIPNSVRVLHNLAQLRLLQVELGSPDEPSVLLEQAKQYCELSLEVTDQDQFPFYLLARIAVKSGDIKAAWDYIYTGRSRPGAVKEKEWAEVEDKARAATKAKVMKALL